MMLPSKKTGGMYMLPVIGPDGYMVVDEVR